MRDTDVKEMIVALAEENKTNHIGQSELITQVTAIERTLTRLLGERFSQTLQEEQVKQITQQVAIDAPATALKDALIRVAKAL